MEIVSKQLFVASFALRRAANVRSLRSREKAEINEVAAKVERLVALWNNETQLKRARVARQAPVF